MESQSPNVSHANSPTAKPLAQGAGNERQSATEPAPPEQVSPEPSPSRPNERSEPTQASSRSITLATPVQYLPGVGPRRVELLAKLGLHTAGDVLFSFPRDYQDLSSLDELDQMVEGKWYRIRGQVLEFEQRGTAKGGTILGVLLGRGIGRVRLLWFNQLFMTEKFRVGQELLVSGKAQLDGLVWKMNHPQVQWLEVDEQEDGGELAPVYPLTEGLAQRQARAIARTAVDLLAGTIEEVLPLSLRAKRELIGVEEALRAMHFPQNRAELDRARRRLAYQELLVLQLGLALKNQRQQSTRGAPPMPNSAKIDARIRRLFPFEFTSCQNTAVREIAADMARDVPMNRLLQGDVGSGKTWVAIYAILLAVAHGQQAALMAPTEVLARQHAATLAGALTESKVRFALLTGSLTAAERRETLSGIESGEIDVVIGTQAITRADANFAKLGLIVIDEQHKFGVKQRAGLRQAGLDPHYLVMTATPIPRTIALTLFGDLEVSTIRESPPGRSPVSTYLANDEQRERWWSFFARKLREGRQGYVITPVVDDSEEFEGTSLETTFENLANGPLESFRLGLIHGRLGAAEKADTMEAFRVGRTQVLVATTVLEVGVDVPNANLMTIEGGERFGLSQLHQLRGRVGRGSHPGVCCVFAGPTSDEGRRRLEAFASTTDGFALAEIDFENRGPGDLLGTRQHGLAPFRVADLVRDAEWLVEARQDAKELVTEDPDLQASKHEALRKMTLRRYGAVLDLGDVG